MPGTVPDDLHIPMPGGGRAPVPSSYRPRRFDDGLVRRWVTVGAAGLGGLLVLGMVGWALVGRKPAVIPVIEADARPLRVKPDNPGGMQFAGADEAVMGGTASGADRMAPTAEVPAPQALRAQMQPSAPAAPAPAVTASAPPATPAPAPVIAGPVAAGVSPLPDTPARPQAAAKPAVAAVPARSAPAPASGGTLVQLAALETEAAAQAEWARLSKRMPDLLGARRLVVQKAERNGQPVYRVRTGGFADTAEATGFCGKLQAKGASCTVASF